MKRHSKRPIAKLPILELLLGFGSFFLFVLFIKSFYNLFGNVQTRVSEEDSASFTVTQYEFVTAFFVVFFNILKDITVKLFRFFHSVLRPIYAIARRGSW
jgi:hypothetical protein